MKLKFGLMVRVKFIIGGNSQHQRLRTVLNSSVTLSFGVLNPPSVENSAQCSDWSER